MYATKLFLMGLVFARGSDAGSLFIDVSDKDDYPAKG